jgi:hypothetical protein
VISFVGLFAEAEAQTAQAHGTEVWGLSSIEWIEPQHPSRTPASVKAHYFFDFTTEEEAPHAYKVHWYGVDKHLFDNTEWCVTKELVPA